MVRERSDELMSLERALEVRGIPTENQSLIRRFTASLGIVEFRDRGQYVEGVRPDGGRSLHIHYGWTNAFASDEEARSASGVGAAWASSARPGLWGIEHPVNKIRGGTGVGASDERSYGTCPECFMELPASGVCCS